MASGKKSVRDSLMELVNPAAPTLKQSEQLNISLIIDTYDDIFSDFDPRPYHERALSEDFLVEVKRRHIPHKKGGLEVRFLVPDNVRDLRTEAVIKRRLKGYFKDEEKMSSKKILDQARRGYAYLAAGTCVLLGITFLRVAYADNLLATTVELLGAPAGWFGMWEGISMIIKHDEVLEGQLDLDQKLAEASFVFIPESEAIGAFASPELEPGNKEVIKEAIKEGIKEGIKEVKRES
jgi:hypothetical protein